MNERVVKEKVDFLFNELTKILNKLREMTYVRNFISRMVLANIFPKFEIELDNPNAQYVHISFSDFYNFLSKKEERIYDILLNIKCALDNLANFLITRKRIGIVDDYELKDVYGYSILSDLVEELFIVFSKTNRLEKLKEEVYDTIKEIVLKYKDHILELFTNIVNELEETNILNITIESKKDSRYYIQIKNKQGEILLLRLAFHRDDSLVGLYKENVKTFDSVYDNIVKVINILKKYLPKMEEIAKSIDEKLNQKLYELVSKYFKEAKIRIKEKLKA